jgi:Cellulase (glycosyl hydrolase family 5)
MLGLLAALLGGGWRSGIAAAQSPIGAHSMLQLDDPPSFMQAMFAQAADMDASAIRLDVAPAIVFGDPSGTPDFSGLDDVVALAAQYHLRVVADLVTIPWWLADCDGPTDLSAMDRCGTDHLSEYQSLISQIVARADPVIRDWEIWNEPDTTASFTGSPQQYALMLTAAHDAIKAVDPQDNVLLGGISDPAGQSWLGQVFATPGADATQAFDIATIHERGYLDELATDVAGWKQYLSSYGFSGPLWVTEHGYPSDPGYQYDPSYAGGAASQGRLSGGVGPHPARCRRRRGAHRRGRAAEFQRRHPPLPRRRAGSAGGPGPAAPAAAALPGPAADGEAEHRLGLAIHGYNSLPVALG